MVEIGTKTAMESDLKRVDILQEALKSKRGEIDETNHQRNDSEIPVTVYHNVTKTC